VKSVFFFGNVKSTVPRGRRTRCTLEVKSVASRVILLGISKHHGLFLLLLLGDSRRVLIRDLTLDTNKVGDISVRVAEGRNEKLVPESSSVDTVVEQADRHVVTLLDGVTDTLDSLGISLRTLQETAVTSQNLVQGVPRKIQETLTGIDNRVVGQTWVGDDKVLLGRLQGLDKGKVRVVEDLVGDSLTGRQESVDAVGVGAIIEELLSLFVAQVRADGGLELFVLLLEQGNTLLQALEQELLADAGALGVFAITFTVDR
jgi:hypothetical protein